MQYLGGKAWAGRRIVAEIERHRKPGETFVDVFCGALSVSRHALPPRLGIDLCRPIVTTFRAAIGGWVPPLIDESDYRRIATNPDPEDPLTGFAMFGCSFGGKWKAGYGGRARRKYARPIDGARKALLEKARACHDLELVCADYRDVPLPEKRIVYCDPPYNGSTGYAAVGTFDQAAFWEWATRLAASGTLVFVSEGAGAAVPQEWAVLSEWRQQLALGLNRTGRERVERLYVFRGAGTR